MTKVPEKSSLILLTGATGYIGSVVAERLLASGYRVRGLTRSEASAAKANSRGIEPFMGNLTDRDTLNRAIEGCTAVIHTATSIQPGPDISMEEAIAISVKATKTLNNLTASAGIRLISTSGTSLYGDTGQNVADESTPTQVPPMFESFAMADQTLIDTPHAHVLRTSIVYGRAASEAIMPVLRGIVTEQSSGYVKNDSILSFVHVEDLADVYLLLLKHAAPPPLTVIASQSINAKDFMSTAGLAVGVDADLKQLSAEEAINKFGPIGMYMGGNMHVSAKLARETLGWKPTRPSILDELTHGSYKYIKW